MFKHGRGFTLIELMIVIAIIAILAAIAFPAYNSQMRKTRRSEALQVLNSIALAEEKWRADHTSYSATWADAGQPAAGPTSKYYTFAAITGATATGYTATATATGDQAYDKASGTGCGTLTLQVASGVTTKSPAVCFNK